jgi:hypothetical protein
MKRVLAISSLSIVIGLALTACTSSSQPSGPSAIPSGSTASSGAASPSSSPASPITNPVASTATPAASPTLGNGSVVCTQAQLTATTGTLFSGAGQQSLAIVFTNHSASTCTVQGFPGVAGLNGSGRQTQQAARLGGPGATLTVAPNASVSATVYTANIPTNGDPDQTCAPFAGGLAVTPPNTTTTVSLTDKADQVSDCGLKITPVAAGTDGNPNAN